MAWIFAKDLCFIYNNPILPDPAAGPGCCLAMWNLKRLLKLAGWTVVGSGSGTGGTFANDDSLLTTAIIMNNPSSYFIIQKPGTLNQFAFQRAGATTSSQTWTVQYCPGGFAAPSSATVLPLSAGADLVSMVSSSALFNTAQQRAHVGVQTVAPYGWFLFAHHNGQLTLNTQMFYDPMKVGSYPAADTEPWIFSCNTSSPWVAGGLQLNNAFPAANNFVAGYLGAVGTPANFICVQAETGVAIPGNVGTNPFTGLDDSPEILWVRRAVLGAPRGSKGLSTVLRWMGTTRSMGSTLSLSGPRDRYCLGNVSVPWDGSVPNI